MPVFDFNKATAEKKEVICTYKTFASSDSETSPEKPILVLDNSKREWNHHSCGVFTNQNQQTAFEFKEAGGNGQRQISCWWIHVL